MSERGDAHARATLCQDLRQRSRKLAEVIDVAAEAVQEVKAIVSHLATPR